MNRITRFGPFNAFDKFAHRGPFRGLDDVYDRFLLRPLLRDNLKTEPQIRMDVRETDKEYLVTADIPGVTRDDIQVSVDGRRVSITAEIKREKNAGERAIRCECTYGAATRSFTLADEIDQERVQARYVNGVLELVLPKQPGSSRRDIPIT